MQEINENCELRGFDSQTGSVMVTMVTRYDNGLFVFTRPGKHTKSYGKPPFFMGKFTINGHFQ
jgi:hypothetical protein